MIIDTKTSGAMKRLGEWDMPVRSQYSSAALEELISDRCVGQGAKPNESLLGRVLRTHSGLRRAA